jgi:hypothetical protein
MTNIVINEPAELEGLYIYIQAKKMKERWFRVLINTYDSSQNHFTVEYQNGTRTVKRLKLLKEDFLIDQTSADKILFKYNVSDKIKYSASEKNLEGKFNADE